MRQHTITIWCILIGSLAYASENFESDYRRQLYQPLQVTDIFGAAQLIKHVLSHSKELKELFEHPMDILRATLIVGGIAAVVKMSLMGVQTLGLKCPELATRFYRKCVAWVMDALGWPTGFDHDQLLMWETIFEQLMSNLCGINIRTGSLDSQADHLWEQYRDNLLDVLCYIQDYLLVHQQYYRARQLQKRRKKRLLVRTVDDNDDHVCFMIEFIVRSLSDITRMCREAKKIHELNVEYIKKVAGNVLVLFKQVRIIVRGDQKMMPYEPYDSDQSWLYAPDVVYQIQGN